MENESLEKLKEQDADAINLWVEKHYKDLYRLLRHLTRQNETAEDLTQQTFLKAIKSVPKFQGKCSMRTWLHRIAFREYAAWRRKHRFLVPLNIEWAQNDQHIHDIEVQEGLVKALHKLHPAQREAFLLFEVQELSIQEIAEITGDSVGTIKSRLHHARERLKKELATTYQQVIHEH